MPDIDPASILAAIHHRRSFKPHMLKPDPVPREILDQVLEAAQWAINHGRTAPWHYTVYTGDARKALGDAFAKSYELDTANTPKFQQTALDSQRKKVFDAPVWIAIGLKPALKPDGSFCFPLEEEMMAVASSVQLLHLAASAFGLGGQWTSGSTAIHPHTAQFVGLTPPQKLLGFFYLGYPNVAWPERNIADPKSHVTYTDH